MTDLEVIKENTEFTLKDLDNEGNEFEKNITLLPDEKIEIKKRSTVFRGESSHQGSGFVIVTNRRIIFLIYHFLGPAKLLYIPLNAISGMNFKSLGFLFRVAKAICLGYNNTSIIFLIDEQKFTLDLSVSTETETFYTLLKEKLPKNAVDETGAPTIYWEYYLPAAGMIIALIFGAIIAGIIGFLVTMLLFPVISMIVDKIINRDGKEVLLRCRD